MKTMTIKLNIQNMSCGHCVSAVKQALESVPGVEQAAVSLESASATVEGNAEIQALLKAVEEEGYTATRQS